jgi:hypothetical protein
MALRPQLGLFDAVATGLAAMLAIPMPSLGHTRVIVLQLRVIGTQFAITSC